MWHKSLYVILSMLLWTTNASARELPNCNAKMIVNWDFGVEEGYYPDATAFDVDGDNYPRRTSN